MSMSLGVGGIMHDFAAVLCENGSVVNMVRAADVTGLPHGVDVRIMASNFENYPPSVAMTRWLRHLKREGVVESVVGQVLAQSDVGHGDLEAVGSVTPTILLPSWARESRGKTRVIDRMMAHGMGVVDARLGDYVLVLDGVGTRKRNGMSEASALLRCSDDPVREWAVFEPSSLGLLLDTAALLNGFAPLHRPSDAFPPISGEAAAAMIPIRTGCEGFEFCGPTWTQMISPDARETYLAEMVGDTGQSARRAFGGAALAVAKSVIAAALSRSVPPDARLWLTGDAMLWPTVTQEGIRLGAHISSFPGDEGTAVGAARLVNRVRS
jgi:hypothetical protein